MTKVNVYQGTPDIWRAYFAAEIIYSIEIVIRVLDDWCLAQFWQINLKELMSGKINV
jgi:hypothetical protein